jgi:hypothetical protein
MAIEMVPSARERCAVKMIPRLCSVFSAFAMLSMCAFSFAAQAVAEVPQARTDVAGVWDLTWETKKGPTKNGYMVIRQEGVRLSAQIHGRGAVKASGTLAGDRFTLRGSKMAVPYTIQGHLKGGILVGSIRVMSVERHFTGVRR